MAKVNITLTFNLIVNLKTMLDYKIDKAIELSLDKNIIAKTMPIVPA